MIQIFKLNMGGGQKISIFVDIIVGSAFVYDIYFRKIPNYLLIAGYAGLVLLIYIRFGWSGLGTALAGVLAVGIPLLIVYLVGGIGAGDVKLMGFMGGFLGAGTGLIYMILVFFIGGITGIVKIAADMSAALSGKSTAQKSKTSIRFSIPILIAYLVLLLSKGGVV